MVLELILESFVHAFWFLCSAGFFGRVTNAHLRLWSKDGLTVCNCYTTRVGVWTEKSVKNGGMTGLGSTFSSDFRPMAECETKKWMPISWLLRLARLKRLVMLSRTWVSLTPHQLRGKCWQFCCFVLTCRKSSNFSYRWIRPVAFNCNGQSICWFQMKVISWGKNDVLVKKCGTLLKLFNYFCLYHESLLESFETRCAEVVVHPMFVQPTSEENRVGFCFLQWTLLLMAVSRRCNHK